MAVFFSRRVSAIVIASMCAMVVVASGCHRWTRRATSALPYSTQPPAGTEINVEAQRLNRRGIRAFERGNLADAEALFRESLEADVSFGPAHNNLGQLFLARHQLYLAAWEFEYAANLMPALVEPVINQGVAYETGGRLDRAIEFYREAYERRPDHPVAIAYLVRALVKQDSSPEEIGLLLDELIMTDGRQRWVEWAKQLRATQFRDYCCGGELHGSPADMLEQPNSYLLDPSDASFETDPMPVSPDNESPPNDAVENEESLELLPPGVDAPHSIGPLLNVSPLWGDSLSRSPISGNAVSGEQFSWGAVPNDDASQSSGTLARSAGKPRPRRIDFDPLSDAPATAGLFRAAVPEGSNPNVSGAAQAARSQPPSDPSPYGFPPSLVNQASFEEPQQ